MVIPLVNLIELLIQSHEKSKGIVLNVEKKRVFRVFCKRRRAAHLAECVRFGAKINQDNGSRSSLVQQILL